jgi:hypothetical protein
MLTSWHAFWHATEPYLFAVGSLAFLVLIVRGLFKGFTATKFSKVYRAESPISFWFFVIFNLLLGVALVGAGLASF